MVTINQQDPATITAWFKQLSDYLSNGFTEDASALIHCQSTNVSLDVNIMVDPSTGSTVAHHAAKYKTLNILTLIDGMMGADFEAKDHRGQTPLMVAVESCTNSDNTNNDDNDKQDALITTDDIDEVIKFLVDTKAVNLNSTDNDGHTAFMKAMNVCNVNLMVYLWDRGDGMHCWNSMLDLDRSETDKILGNVNIVKTLVDHGLDWKRANQKNRSIIRCAAHYGHTGTLKYLVEEQGAAGNVLHTPLAFACIEGKLETTRYLLSQGANIKELISSWEMNEFFEIACQKWQLDIVMCFAECGANVNSLCCWEKNHYPLPPLVYLEAYSLEVASVLIKCGANVNFVDEMRGQTLLHRAVWCSFDLDRARFWIKHGLNVNQADFGGCTPLLKAVDSRNYLDAMNFLIDNGANVNLANKKGTTPLHRAVSNENRIEGVTLLIQSGAIVNLADNCGCTPLHLAVSKSKIDIMRLLLQSGAEVNHADKNGSTPLHVAISQGNSLATKLLMEHGANTNPADNKCRTSLQIAVSESFHDGIKLLVSYGANVNQTNHILETPLHTAVWRRDVASMRLLIDHGADINYPNENGITPLHIAVCKGGFDHIRLLVQNGANVNISNKIGQTPLHLAVCRGKTYSKLLTYLKEMGTVVIARNHPNNFFTKRDIDWQRVDHMGRDVLHYAAEHNNVDALRYFIEANGANVNNLDASGASPLAHAYVHEHLESIKYLASQGSNLNFSSKIPLSEVRLAKESNGSQALPVPSIYDADESVEMTPLARACWLRKFDLVRCLVMAGFDTNVSDCFGVPIVSLLVGLKAPLKTIKCAIKKGSKIDSVDGKGYTAMHYACDLGRFDAVKLLIDMGSVSINVRSNENQTPLCSLVAQCYCCSRIRAAMDMIKFLLDNGADINCGSVRGMCPLAFASVYSMDLVKLFLDYGANINQTSEKGDTPLMIALAMFDQIKAVGYSSSPNTFAKIKYLVEKGASIGTKNHAGQSVIDMAYDLKAKCSSCGALYGFLQKEQKEQIYRTHRLIKHLVEKDWFTQFHNLQR